MADHYFKKDEIIKDIYVFDNGVIKGFIQMNETEICKLYVDIFFQSSFYQRHGFHLTGQKKLEEDTTEYLVKLER